ncbi:Uncharacterized protein RNJ44_00263 [Nakaseomyces bracarensis]|uniref:Uncharacterized protein n=1 Tax=Nakaseomyces bracarensis TaxID=273131 RepID=A0ABR4NTD2_9SACH
MQEQVVKKPRSGFLYTFIYIFVVQSLPSAIIAGGVEFAIAYGMYQGVSDKITLWRFPHTLSGDCALTVFIQVCVTLVSEELIIGYEDYQGKAGKIPCPWVPQNKWIRLYFDVDRGMRRMYAEYLDYQEENDVMDEEKKHLENPDNSGITEESDEIGANKEMEEDEEDKRSSDPMNSAKSGFQPMTTKEYLHKLIVHYDNHGLFWNFVEWLIQKVARGLIMAAVIWFFMWPVCMGILAGIGHKTGSHEYYFNHYPLPQVMKLIYAVAIAFASTPLSIIAIMLRNDWYEKQYQESLNNNTNDQVSVSPSTDDELDVVIGRARADNCNQIIQTEFTS